MAFIDNGDGTITTDGGIRIAKPFGMGAPPPPLPVAPGIMASVAPGMDARTASAEDVIRGALAPKPPPGTLVLPDQDMTSTPDVGKFRLATPSEAARFPSPNAAPSRPTPSGDASKVAALLGNPEPELPGGLKPANRTKPEDEGDTVAPEDRVRVGGGGPGVGGGPGFSPARVIDQGGMRPVQETIQKGTPIPKELKDQFEENTLTHRAANEASRLASEESNAQTAELATSHANEEEARLQRSQERAQRHQLAMQEATTKLDAMTKDARDNPVNQDSYWQEKGSGAKVLSGLYVAMDEISSLGTRRQGGTVATIVDKQINDWMADKKERRQVALEGQRSLVGMTRANFESEAAQDAALRSQAYDAYRAKLGAITAGAASEKEKAAALQLDADLADKALDWKTKAAQLEADHVTVHQKMVGPTVVGGAPKVGALDRGLVVQDLNGQKFYARDPEQARALNKVQPLTLGAVDAANEMAAIANESAGKKLDPSSPLGKRFAFARERFVNAVNSVQGQGVVKDDDIKRYRDDILGGEFGLSTAEAAKRHAAQIRTAFGYALKAGADTETPLAEDFQQNPKTGALEKVPHYKVFNDTNGTRVPIAFSAAGKGRKTKR